MVSLISKKKKSWRTLEFVIPIKETFQIDKDFMIRGTAINETTTRNNITYVAEELETSAVTLRNKPILKDHLNKIDSIIGRTTDNVYYNTTKKAIEFEGKIMDDDVKKKINDGRIQSVSVGAIVKNLEKTTDQNGTEGIIARGIDFVELSLVAVPADPNAGFERAIFESWNLKNKIDQHMDDDDNYPEHDHMMGDHGDMMGEDETGENNPERPPMVVQTLILSKDKFKSVESARAWVKDHDFKSGGVDETDDSYRFRQRDPDNFIPGSFKTFDVTDGVKAVGGRLKKEKEAFDIELIENLKKRIMEEKEKIMLDEKLNLIKKQEVQKMEEEKLNKELTEVLNELKSIKEELQKTKEQLTVKEEKSQLKEELVEEKTNEDLKNYVIEKGEKGFNLYRDPSTYSDLKKFRR